MSFVGVVFRRR